MESRHDVCVSIDRLLLEELNLIQRKVETQINIENASKAGGLHLAKSRYIMGQNTVSALQLPTENTPDFDALSTTDRTQIREEKFTYDEYALNEKEADDKSVNPIKWFGVLVPQNLYLAQNTFKKAVEYVIESVNVENRLRAVCDEIARLKDLKHKLTPEE